MTSSIGIFTRTFSGHEPILRRNLLSTASVFVNRSKYQLGIVLDNETAADHRMGDQLLAEDKLDVVRYEDLPDNHRALFQALAYPWMPWGYDRQQWSTFYMDTFTDRDVIGVVDSDSTFTSYLTDERIFTPDGKIKLHGVKPLSSWKHWSAESKKYVFKNGAQHVNDDIALKFDTEYDLMCTNLMPMFFWKTTFHNLRNYISSIWDMSFDEAYKVFSRKPYCQFNILANYALRFEPDKYEFVDVKLPSVDKVIAAQNGCPTSRDTFVGLLRSFRITEDRIPKSIRIQCSRSSSFGKVALNLTHQEFLDDSRHANNFAHFLNVPCSKEDIDAHYSDVYRDIDRLPDDERKRLDLRVESFLTNEFNGIIIKG